MNLKEIRAKYEKATLPFHVDNPLRPVVILDQRDSHGRVFVVLEDFRKRQGVIEPIYNCHRYFTIGKNWECSIDKQSVSLNEVWEWLNGQNPANFEGA